MGKERALNFAEGQRTTRNACQRKINHRNVDNVQHDDENYFPLYASATTLLIVLHKSLMDIGETLTGYSVFPLYHLRNAVVQPVALLL